MHKDTCVVIPVFNEESIVADVINDASKYFSRIICVDDGSTDGSVKAIKRTRARLVRHPKNRGQGAAIRTGIETALQDPRVKYVVTFDADGQHSSVDADRMVRHIKANKELDVVLGSRFLGEAKDIGAVKLGVLKIAIFMSNLFSGMRLTDTHNGLRVFNRQFAENLQLISTGFAHASEIIYKVARNKYVYKELPVTISYSDYSKAKRPVAAQIFTVLFETLKHRALKTWRVES